MNSITIDKDIIYFFKGDGDYKYKAYVLKDNGERLIVDFGDKHYSQYKDQTPLQLYKDLNHLDEKRRLRYRKRHGGIYTKDGVLAYKVKYSPAWFSWHFLW